MCSTAAVAISVERRVATPSPKRLSCGSGRPLENKKKERRPKSHEEVCLRPPRRLLFHALRRMEDGKPLCSKHWKAAMLDTGEFRQPAQSAFAQNATRRMAHSLIIKNFNLSLLFQSLPGIVSLNRSNQHDGIQVYPRATTTDPHLGSLAAHHFENEGRIYFHALRPRSTLVTFVCPPHRGLDGALTRRFLRLFGPR
jgi:hypothetical protein